jgi:uncharacterized protein
VRYLVLSDTHGRVEPAMQVYRRHSEEKPLDAIIHLGDFASDAKALAVRLGARVIWVKGNMDGSFSAEDYEILESEAGSILLIHGHMQSVKVNVQRLLYRTEELGCVAVLYGHTHEPSIQNVHGIYMLNPGSLTFPRHGQGSYAILDTSNGFGATILFYDPKPEVKGGHLYDMLNNSDRA